MDDRSRKTSQKRILWWIAGADGEVLADCPKGDQLFVSHLGIALSCAFLFVFLITAIAINVAFPNLDAFAQGWAVLFAALIGTTVFLVDRSFIISDWDWQASLRRDELARADWERPDMPSPLGPSWQSRAFARIRRTTAILFRLVLSVAIGYSIATFLELVIYRDEIRPQIEAQHYRDNKSIYDRIGERQNELAYEIKLARDTRDRLQMRAATAEDQIADTIANPPKGPSQAKVADIDRRIGVLEKEMAAEEAKARTYEENVVAELFGTKVNDGNSGIEGQGRRYQTNIELKKISETRIASIKNQLTSASGAKREALEGIEKEQEAVAAATRSRLAGLREQAQALRTSGAEAQTKYERLIDGRSEQLAAYTADLKRSADFLPISYGIESQFRALRALYETYGNWAEHWMVKALIMLLELTPIIMKIFLSPKTLYAIKLDAKRRERSYEHLNVELSLRQEHLRRKFDAAMDEQMDGRGLDLLRKDNVTPIKEAKGAV